MKIIGYILVFVLGIFSYAEDIESLIQKLNNKDGSYTELDNFRKSIENIIDTNKNNVNYLFNIYLDCKDTHVQNHILKSLKKESKYMLIKLMIEKINLLTSDKSTVEENKLKDEINDRLNSLSPEIGTLEEIKLNDVIVSANPDNNFLKEVVLTCRGKHAQQYAFRKIKDEGIKKELLINKHVSNYVKNKNILSYVDSAPELLIDIILSLNNDEKSPSKSDFENFIIVLNSSSLSDESYMKLIQPNVNTWLIDAALDKIKNQSKLFSLLKDNKDSHLEHVIFDRLNDEMYLQSIAEQDFDYLLKEEALKKLCNPSLTYDYYRKLVKTGDQQNSFNLITNVISDRNILKVIMDEEKSFLNRGAAALKFYNINDNNVEEKVKLIKDKNILKGMLDARMITYGKDPIIYEAINSELRSRGLIGKFIMMASAALMFLLILLKTILVNKKKTYVCELCSNHYDFSHSWCPVCGTLDKKNFFYNEKFINFYMFAFSLFLLGLAMFIWKPQSFLLFLSIGLYLVSGFLFLGSIFTYKDHSEQEKEMIKLKENNNLLVHSDENIRVKGIGKIIYFEKLKELEKSEKSEKVKEAIEEKLKTFSFPEYDKNAVNSVLDNDFRRLKNWIERGANVNACNENKATLLFIAASKGNDRIVEFLLEKGADPNKDIVLEATPLFVAVQGNGHMNIVKQLLNSGANPNKQDHEGNTPLIIAASEKGNPEFAKILIDNGAKVDLVNDKNMTALYFASQNGYLEFIKVLIDNRADINIAMYQGATPLFIASQVGNVEVVKILLENGADKTKAVANKVTPYDIAVEYGHLEIANLLKNDDISVKGESGNKCIKHEDLEKKRVSKSDSEADFDVEYGDQASQNIQSAEPSIELICHSCKKHYHIQGVEGETFQCPHCKSPGNNLDQTPPAMVNTFYGLNYGTIVCNCAYCGKTNSGILVRDQLWNDGIFYSQKLDDPDGKFHLKTTCIHCERDYHIAWDISVEDA